MRKTVVKAERFYIVIEVQQRVFDTNTIENFLEIFNKELEQASEELREEVERKFNEIKQSAEGASGEGGDNS